MNKIRIYSIATFMIALIVTIPFYIADAFAESRIDTIQYPTPSGTGETQGFMRSSDVLTIIANIYSTSLDASQLPSKLKFGTYQFTACNALGQANWFNCSFIRQFTGIEPIVVRSLIELTAADCTNCEVPVTIVVDGFAPTISKLDLFPNLTGGNEISVSYEVNDIACEQAECSEKCSGIKKLTIFTDGSFSNPLKVFDVNQAPNSPNSCAISDLLKVPVDLSSGKYSLCIVASDGAGNGGYFDKVCKDLTIDREPPKVDSAKIYIGNKEALFIPQGGTLVNLSVNLTSELSRLKDITVDLSQFGIGNQSFFNKCENVSDKWSCTHQFFLSIPFGATSVGFPIYVTDEAGNTLSYSFSQPISVDSTPPVFSSIRTNYVWNNTLYWGKQRNMLFADLIEAQSGFFNKAVLAKGLNKYLQLPEGSDSERDYIGNCTQLGGTWRCYWPALDLRSDVKDGQIYIEIHGWDDAQNIFSQSVPIFIDTTNPALGNISVKEDNVVKIKNAQDENAKLNALVVETNNNFPAVIAGDSIKIVADFIDNGALKDDSGIIYPSMNLTEIEGGPSFRKADDCDVINKTSDGENIWRCSWIVNGVISTGNAVTFDINVSDIAGNHELLKWINPLISYNDPTKAGEKTLAYVDQFKILARELNQTPDYWKYTVGKPTPRAVDRQVIPIFNQLVYFGISPQQLDTSKSIIPISVYLKECENDGTAKDFKFFYAGKDPYIEVTLEIADLSEVEWLSYNCTLGTISRINDLVSQEEIDNINLTISLYNMPLGKYDQAVKAKINWIKDLAENDLFVIINYIKKIIDTMKTICGVWNTIASIVGVIHSINAIWKDGCKTIPFCSPVAVAAGIAEGTADGALASIGKFVKRYVCDVVTCNLPWNQYYKEFIKDLTPQLAETLSSKGWNIKDVASYVSPGGGFWPADPSESLILSAIALCPQGVLYNIEKYRQIMCRYGYCYITSARDGKPLYMCEEIYHFQICTAIWGDVFSAIPFAAAFENIVGMIFSYLNNTISFLFGNTILACRIGAPDTSTALYSICAVLSITDHILKTIVQAYNSFEQITKGFKATWSGADNCEAFLDEYKRMEDSLKKEE